MGVPLCSRCGAPLTRPADGSALVCRFCGAEDAPPPLPPVLPADVGENPRLMAIIGVSVIVGCAMVWFALNRAADNARSHPESPVQPPVAVVPVPVPVEPAPVPVVTPTPVDPSLVPTSVTLSLHHQGGEPGAFDHAIYVAVDAQGFGYVVDHTGRVQRFDETGAFVSSFRSETTNPPHGPASDDIGTAQGLAVDRKGRVWVSMGYDLIAYDATSGKQLIKVPHHYPHTCYRDITLDQTGQIFVVSACTDPNVYAIVKMDASGHTLATFPESADWEHDTSDRIAIDGAGNLFEPHMYEGVVVEVDAHARPVTRIGGSGEALGYFHRGYAPRGLAIDPGGRLFATNGDDIDVYDHDGHAKGRLERRWKSARDLAFGPDGQLWVVHDDGVVRVKIGS